MALVTNFICANLHKRLSKQSDIAEASLNVCTSIRDFCGNPISCACIAENERTEINYSKDSETKNILVREIICRAARPGMLQNEPGEPRD